MPFEVWKTHMGRFRKEGTIEAFRNIYRRGGGIGAFWAGLPPKLVESATKGSILLFSKETFNRLLIDFGMSATPAGFVAGGLGGVCQVTVMGPCTFLVTAMVTSDSGGPKMSNWGRMVHTYRTGGVAAFYSGGTAIMWRQATNWASRQGFTEMFRGMIARRKVVPPPPPVSGADKKKPAPVRLSVWEEAMAGIAGGAISCWNHPFEVARIQMQATTAAGQTNRSMMRVIGEVYRQGGPTALFAGIVPRIGLGIWQTLFMVSGANIIKQRLP